MTALTTFDHLLDCRGTFIVPSFDEIWPQPGKERTGKARTRMGYDYILEAMQVTRMVLVMILMKILGKKILLMVMMAADKAIKIVRSTTILAIFLSLLMMILKMILLMILMLILIITMVWTKEKQ